MICRSGEIEKYDRKKKGFTLYRHDPKKNDSLSVNVVLPIFDLVITDMTMPKMTGDQSGQHILAIRPDIPIILCTGYSENITDEKAKQIGFSGFAMKPAVMKELATLIRRVLEVS